jgi:hypothetical protein
VGLPVYPPATSDPCAANLFSRKVNWYPAGMSEAPKRPEWELKPRGVLSIAFGVVALCMLGGAVLLALAGFILLYPF